MNSTDLMTDENLTVQVANAVSRIKFSKPIKKFIGGVLGFIGGGLIYLIVAQPDWAMKE